MLTTDLTHTFTATITPQHSAISVGSGDVEVLGTPAMLALMEQATVALVAPHLEPGSSSVGTHIEVDHTRATAIGEEVTITARLREIDGRKLTFLVEASDRNGSIGTATVVRFVIDRERFMAKLG